MVCSVASRRVKLQQGNKAHSVLLVCSGEYLPAVLQAEITTELVAGCRGMHLNKSVHFELTEPVRNVISKANYAVVVVKC